MLHTEHAYCLSYRFLNNVVITTIIEMVQMVEILDGRLGQHSVERVRYVTRIMVTIKKRAGVIPYSFLSSIALLSSLLSCSFDLLDLRTISSVDILEMT